MKQLEQPCEDSVKPELFLSEDMSDSEEFDGQETEQPIDEGFIELSENEVVLRFSASLMSKLKKTAHAEGLEIDELAGELITESLALRAAADLQRSGGPSHLMTRTGYLPPDANGNSVSQPFLSHHQNGNGHANGRGGNRRNNGGRSRNSRGNNNPNRRSNGNGNSKGRQGR